MNLFSTILLVIVAILLMGDLFYTRKVLNLENKTDNKHVKFNQYLNLLKSVSIALLLALYFTNDNTNDSGLKEKAKDLENTIQNQQEKLSRLDDTLKMYKKNLDSLIEFKKQFNNVTKPSNSTLKQVNTTTSKTSPSKYNPKVYVVNGLSFPDNVDTMTFKFAHMETIHGENIPNFKKAPFVNIQGYGCDIDILEVTPTHVTLNLSVIHNCPKKNSFKFDLWIGSQE